MSTPISLIPAAFHRHAAAAAANPSGKGLVLASVGLSTYNCLLITGNFLALYCQCHCRQCRQPGHFPLKNDHHHPHPAQVSLIPAAFFVGDDDDDDDKPLSIGYTQGSVINPFITAFQFCSQG